MPGKLTKLTAATLIGAAILCTAALAEPSKPTSRAVDGPNANGPMRDPAKLLERGREIARSLKLTDEQKTKVDTIYEKALSDMKEMRSQLEELEPRERKRQATEFLMDVRQQISAVLDSEQRRLFDKKIDEERAAQARASLPEAGGPRPLERLKENLEKLDLTGEQKTKVKTLMQETGEKALTLLKKVEPGTDEMRQQTMALREDVQRELKEILTPEQGEKLRELMGPLAAGGNATTKPAKGDIAMKDTEMMSPDMKADAKKPAAKPIEEEVKASALTRTGPRVGEPAPTFMLKKLDGSVANLAQFKGRIVVLEFGSYSCPSFRQRAAAMEQLKTEMGRRAEFMIIYTKEAHPAGKWDVDRNKNDGISIEDPADDGGRKATAKTAQEKLKISIPIALDKFDNAVTDAYGLFPNGAVIIGRDGNILMRQQWAEPFALKAALETAVAAKPATHPAAD